MNPTTGYILSTEVKGCRYYVQEYRGKLCLNGLIDNSIVFLTKDEAKKAMASPEIYRYTLQVVEVLVTPKA